jgi:hypothetical protein
LPYTAPLESIQIAARLHRHGASLRDACVVWARVAALSFGGPAGQIAVHAYGLLFDTPDIASADLFALALSAAAIVAIFSFCAGTIETLVACSGAGVVLHLSGGIG